MCRIKALQTLFKEKTRPSTQPNIVVKHWEAELAHYTDLYQKNPVVTNEGSLQFWKQNSKTFPCLSDLATDILCCPASTATVERMFSIAGEACSGRRNKLSGSRLECEILIRQNIHYL